MVLFSLPTIRRTLTAPSENPMTSVVGVRQDEGKSEYTHEIMVMRNGMYSDTIIHDADAYEQFYISSESFKHEQPK